MAKNRIVLSVMVGVGLWMLLWYGVLRRASGVMENACSFALYPILCMQQAVIDSVHGWVRERRDNAELKQLLTETSRECEQLRAENIRLLATQKYGDDIAELDSFRRQYSVSESLIARVLFKHFSPKEHYFLVELGAQQGVKKNMVAVYKNCLLGKVEEVYPWYSKVVLVTDASCKVAAYCAETKVNGIYQGCNETDTALLQYVSHFEPIALRDTLISSGEGLIFPQGFSLGAIESCQQDGLYHRIQVVPHIDVQTLSYCVLITRG